MWGWEVGRKSRDFGVSIAKSPLYHWEECTLFPGCMGALLTQHSWKMVASTQHIEVMREANPSRWNPSQALRRLLPPLPTWPPQQHAAGALLLGSSDTCACLLFVSSNTAQAHDSRGCLCFVHCSALSYQNSARTLRSLLRCLVMDESEFTISSDSGPLYTEYLPETIE